MHLQLLALPVHGTLASFESSSSSTELLANSNSKPLSEILDLQQNGTLGSPYLVNLSKDFLRVSEIVLSLQFSTNSVNYNKFADDTALTNGINIVYNSYSLLNNNNLTNNADLLHLSYESSINTDGQSPANNIIVTKLSFDDNLVITNRRPLQFYIQDDLSSLTTIDSFNATIFGTTRLSNNLIAEMELWYPNAINTVNLHDLLIKTEYQVHFNTTTNTVDNWSNFTAESTDVSIKTYLKNIQDSDQNVYIYLYEDGEYRDQFVVLIQSQSLDFITTIFKVIPTIVLFAVAVIIGLTLISYAQERLH